MRQTFRERQSGTAEQQNSGRNAEGARGYQTKQKIQQSTCQGTSKNTPIQEEGKEGKEEKEGGGKKEQRRREERRAIPRLLFLGAGGGGAPTSTSPVLRRCEEGSGSGGEGVG